MLQRSDRRLREVISVVQEVPEVGFEPRLPAPVHILLFALLGCLRTLCHPKGVDNQTPGRGAASPRGREQRAACKSQKRGRASNPLLPELLPTEGICVSQLFAID